MEEKRNGRRLELDVTIELSRIEDDEDIMLKATRDKFASLKNRK